MEALHVFKGKLLKHPWRTSLFVLAVVCLLVGASLPIPSATACHSSSLLVLKGEHQPLWNPSWPSFVFYGEIKGPICGGGDEGVTGGQEEEEDRREGASPERPGD